MLCISLAPVLRAAPHGARCCYYLFVRHCSDHLHDHEHALAVHPYGLFFAERSDANEIPNDFRLRLLA
jgi:hypothetical protein